MMYPAEKQVGKEGFACQFCFQGNICFLLVTDGNV